MMRVRSFSLLSFSLLVGLCATCLLASRFSEASERPAYVTFSADQGGFCLASKKRATPILLDSEEWPGVVRAARDLQTDLGKVTGEAPTISQSNRTPSGPARTLVLIGTVGRSVALNNLESRGKIDLSPIRGKWESSITQVVANPWPGVDRALIVAGSDKRGTIYAIYSLSEQSGVSPWYWWADVPIKHHSFLSITSGVHVQPSPVVKYRGIFLNDEAPALSGWVKEHFGEYNHHFYTHVFELLLRLKANYLWPAMWNNCFSQDDPLNPKLADEYGIVMGTSHVEPMMRADKEWNRAGYEASAWNYLTHPKELEKFWADGVERNKPYENIITIAMRGKIDTPMSETANISLLETIVAAQRKIIAEHVKADVTQVPQLWCLYKEVQEYYEKGMRVPDDVTLLWSDDNWGDIRRLPTPEEQNRSGGAGVYYHFDYVGGPRNYKWINTNTIPKIWEQMSLAHRYGADRIWIVNVGDLKPMEFPMEFFLEMAWDPGGMSSKDMVEFTDRWAGREFGQLHAHEIAEIMRETQRINGRRKPELLEPGTYSIVNDNEAERLTADLKSLLDRAHKIQLELTPELKDSYYELVLHPLEASANLNLLYIAAAKNMLYAKQGRSEANEMADEVEARFKKDVEIKGAYHAVAGGKWNHMMDQTHIGYTSWQEPPVDVMPPVTRINPPLKAAIGVAAEGSEVASTADGSPNSSLKLPQFNPDGAQYRWVDIFNRGAKPFRFVVHSDVPWITVLTRSGTVHALHQRCLVAIDWRKVSEGISLGHVLVSQVGGPTISVKVETQRRTDVEKAPDGWREDAGVVAIDAVDPRLDHGHGSQFPSKFLPFTFGTMKGWEEIPGYGRTGFGMESPPAAGAKLDYSFCTLEPGPVTLTTYAGTSLGFRPGHGLQFKIAIDDETPQLLDIAPTYLSADWETAVKDSVRAIQSHHRLLTPGLHTLHITSVDPGVVLEKFILDLGGLKPSYLGPEARRRGSEPVGQVPHVQDAKNFAVAARK